jgi:hypothetical protein
LGYVRLFIPEFVKDEFISATEEDITSQLDDHLRFYDRIDRKGLQKNEVKLAQALASNIRQLRTEVKNSILRSWTAFENASSARIVQIDFEQCKSAISSYFEGSAPYSTRKNRNDIPDAFIFHAIKDLALHEESIFFISGDKRLSKIVKNELKIKCFETVSAFLEVDEIDKIIQHLAVRQRSLAYIIRIPEFENKYVEAIQDGLLKRTYDLEIIGDQIPSYDHKGRIAIVTKYKSYDFKYKNIMTLFDYEFMLPFIVDATAEVQYAVDKSEYSFMPDDRLDRIQIHDENEFVFIVSETMEILIEGMISVAIPQEEIDVDIASMGAGDIIAQLEIVNKAFVSPN